MKSIYLVVLIVRNIMDSQKGLENTEHITIMFFNWDFLH